MLDQPDNSEPFANGGLKPRRKDSAATPRRPRPAPPADSGEPKRTARGKVPIINQKGPSEVDRAIRMAKANSARSVASGRKVAEGTQGRGTVVRIDRVKGFGFLIDAAGEQRFFHRSAVLDSGFANLREQQTVDFEAHNDERGARAVKVKPASSSAAPGKSSPRTPASPKTAKPASGWRSDLMPFRNGTGAPTTGRKKY
ncbi:MAG TPA: cold shock domain-containing protein [Chloroflexota bacterium]|nr:cold shock domain-containing protein [Chloroflexota bacterium]